MSKEAPSDEEKPSSLAIAYGVKKKNAKKMAEGGKVTPIAGLDAEKGKKIKDGFDKNTGESGLKNQWDNLKKAAGYAAGGMIEPDDEMDEDPAESVAGMIMRKRQEAKMMAEGGLVGMGDDLSQDDNDEQMDLDAMLKEDYGSEDEEEKAEIEMDHKDMIAAIRAKMKAKRS